MVKKCSFLIPPIVGLIFFVTAAIMGSPFLTIAAVLFSLFSIGVWLIARSSSEPNFENEMISMVALFETLPFLNEDVLAKHVKLAWGIEFETSDEAETFVAGNSPLFVIKTEDRMYTVNHFDRPYFDNTEDLVDGMGELRMKHVLELHRGWISVDLMSKSDNMDLEYEYSKIGQLLNEMIDDQGLGILIPQYMRLVPWDESIESAITSSAPLTRLAPSNPPVVPIEDDDPSMKAAVAEARANWLDFVREYEKHMRDEDRDESRSFSVKAPITVVEQTEFIWVNVTGIENSVIYGTLGNEPVSLSGLNEGDRVRIPVRSLNDWVYTDQDKMVGGFTIKVLRRWADSQVKESKVLKKES